MEWNAPKLAAGVCSGKLPAIDSKLAVHYCIMHKLHESSKKSAFANVLAGFVHSVVSARACANQFLP